MKYIGMSLNKAELWIIEKYHTETGYLAQHVCANYGVELTYSYLPAHVISSIFLNLNFY